MGDLWAPVSSTVVPWCLKQAMNAVGPPWMCSGGGSTECLVGQLGVMEHYCGLYMKDRGYNLLNALAPFSYFAIVKFEYRAREKQLL